MERTFDFGKINYEGKGKINLVTVEVELRKNENKTPACYEFSACGNIWNRRKSDLLSAGQNLDEIAKYITDPDFEEIYKFWKEYHLNGMHPECEHQRALGWIEKARTEVKIYHWRLTQKVYREKSDIEKMAIEAVKAGVAFSPTPLQSFICGLEYVIETPAEQLPEKIRAYYEPEKSLLPVDKGAFETKTLGWLRESEHPDGILCKPCPVCGYKYGTEWKVKEIPESVLSEIKKLLGMEVEK